MTTFVSAATTAEAGLPPEVRRLLSGPRIDGLLSRAAQRDPDRTALQAGDTTWTYAELDAQADRYAGVLATAATAGEVVALSAVLQPVFAAAYYGVSRAGMVSAIINPFLREEGLLHVLATCRASVAVVSPAVYRRLAALRDRLPDLRTVWLTEPADDLPDVPALELLTGAGVPSGDPDGAALASVLFTSGTTGAPKAVGLTHDNLRINAAQTAYAQGLDERSVMLNHLPTFHLMHLNIAVAAGATHVLCTDDDVVDAVRLAAELDATHLYDLPVRFARLAADPRLPELRLPAVHGLLSGGSALGPDAAATLSAHFQVPVAQGYGLAEASPSTHFDSFATARTGSCGRPVPGTGCRILDLDTGDELPAGGKGLIQVRGPQLMPGYLYQEVTEEIDEHGWFSTGDVGYLDADGYLFVTDRLKDVFKTDNFLVSPTEIERVLARHPGVAECVVVDLPDPQRGALAAAIVVPTAGSTASTAELAAFVAEKLPYYQHLHRIEPMTAIPRSPNGKIQRRDLRALLLNVVAPSRSTQPYDSASRADRRTTMFLVNSLKVTGDQAEFEKALGAITSYMKAQPGFVSHQLYRSLRNPNSFVEIAEWEGNGGHGKAMASPVFQELIKALLAHATADPDMYALVQNDVTVAA